MTSHYLTNVHFHKGINQQDNRGAFSKFWTDISCDSCPQPFIPKEVFFSKSNRGVIRGFHFQAQPLEIAKIVKVISGTILDVSFPVFPEIKLEFREFVLDESSDALYIPNNYAHAFQVISNEANVLYLTDGAYSKTFDSGFHWSSFANWKELPLTVSDRDSNFQCLADGSVE
jgi:dTDP-4-dehydrorhamnose 3,5-epimerase